MRYIVYLESIILALILVWLVSELLPMPLECTKDTNVVLISDSTHCNIAITATSTEIDIVKKTIKKNTANTLNIDTLLQIAKQYIGTPYKMGGTTFEGMDCSGLLVTIFKQMGYKLPHNSSELAKNGILIPKIEQLTEGDLLFFHTEWENKSLINHTGLYLGKGYFLHASSSQGTIISRINSASYRNAFICGSRILLPQPSSNLMSRNRLVILKHTTFLN